MKNTLEKYLYFLYKKYGLTPDFLSYIRIFSAPWLALLVAKIISGKSLPLTIFTLIIYTFVLMTDYLDGILARKISATGERHDHSKGGMLDRLSDKILIIFLLIPFGLNLFTFSIILAESILAYQAIFSLDNEKQAKYAGKIKMILQTFLIPILLLGIVTNFIPEMIIYIYIIITIIASYVSIYSHYFYFEND